MPLVRYLYAATYLLTLAAPTVAFSQEKISRLNGEWTSDCLPIGKNDRHGYITRITIIGQQLTATSQVYAKSSCQTPTVQVNFKGELIQEQADGDRARIEVAVHSITTTPNIQDVVDHYNRDTADQAGCGLKGWEENVPLSVAGKTCGPFSFAAEGTHLFDAVWIEGDQLRFGAFPTIWTNTSPDKTPSKPLETAYHRTGR
ncbi:hypothetical protein GGE68_003228 [Rhizobium leguminosarum]|uniref:hypothetical protein n=1 Tax=Rhizobium leguminosarum TaxID=384 RepID=UPI0016160B9C|nr:hypothetical protein [Rhizobium leguminosarum]MBB5665031.1 hypothetical protein [Rhizobium leguminosarum]